MVALEPLLPAASGLFQSFDLCVQLPNAPIRLPQRAKTPLITRPHPDALSPQRLNARCGDAFLEFRSGRQRLVERAIQQCSEAHGVRDLALKPLVDLRIHHPLQQGSGRASSPLLSRVWTPILPA